jgi:hypothetical protein
MDFAARKPTRVTTVPAAEAVVDHAALPEAEKEAIGGEIKKRDNNPWLSVSDALIANKCWVCDTPFQRGYRKKVFQISQLVGYLVQRSGQLKKEAEVDASPSSSSTSELLELSSHNFRSWFEAFVEDLDGSEAKLEDALKQKNVTMWFSGLVCCKTEECLRQYQLIAPPTADELAAGGGKVAPGGAGKLAAADCPPGCLCDNPWPFLS